MTSKKHHDTSHTALHMMSQESLIPSVSRWSFASCQESEGVQSFPISYNKTDVILNIGGAMAPFDASAHPERETSRSLLLKLPAIWENSFEQLDALLVSCVAGESQKFFGAKLSEDEVRERYKSITKKVGAFPRNLKLKLRSGYYASRFWNSDREAMEQPSDFSQTTYNVIVKLRALWFTREAWGIVCDATDFQQTDAMLVECPF